MMNSRHVYEANLPMKISYSRLFYSLNYSCVFKAPLIKVNNDFKEFSQLSVDAEVDFNCLSHAGTSCRRKAVSSSVRICHDNFK